MQVDGQSHVVHSEEEALGTRLTIDSLTCLLANETDPSRLVAVSPGKLMRYLVPEGAHVCKDQPYLEVEVRPPSLLLALSSKGRHRERDSMSFSSSHCSWCTLAKVLQAHAEEGCPDGTLGCK